MRQYAGTMRRRSDRGKEKPQAGFGIDIAACRSAPVQARAAPKATPTFLIRPNAEAECPNSSRPSQTLPSCGQLHRHELPGHSEPCKARDDGNPEGERRYKSSFAGASLRNKPDERDQRPSSMETSWVNTTAVANRTDDITVPIRYFSKPCQILPFGGKSGSAQPFHCRLIQSLPFL